MLSRDNIRGPSKFKVFATGEYMGTLIKISDCKVDTIDKQGNVYVKTGETDGVRLTFKTEDGSLISYKTKKSCHRKSNLFKVLQMSYGSKLRQEVQFNSANFASDPDYFFDMLEILEDRMFILSIETNESKTFSKITEWEPKEKGRVPSVEEARSLASAKAHEQKNSSDFESHPDHKEESENPDEKADISYDEDDIPF